MIGPEEVRALRVALGRQLAEFREAAGYSQHTFAPRAQYSRSTIANIETGKQNVPRDFWLRIDPFLHAGGVLLATYTQLEQLMVRHQQDSAAARTTRSTPSLQRRPAASASEVARNSGATTSVEVELLRRGVSEAIGTDSITGSGIADWAATLTRHGLATRFQPAVIHLGDLVTDFTELRRVLSLRHSASRLRDLTLITAQMAGLMSLTLLKMGEATASRNWGRTARQAALEAGDPHVQSWVLAQEAFGDFYAGHHVEAIRVAHHAQTISGQRSSVGAALAAALEARAHAALGHVSETREALTRAEGFLGDLEDGDRVDSAFGYNHAQLQFHAGNAYTHLHDTPRAWQAQQAALELYPLTEQLDRALVQLDRASCLAQDGVITDAVTWAAEAIMPLTVEQRAGLITRRGHELLHLLPAGAGRLERGRELTALLTAPTKEP